MTTVAADPDLRAGLTSLRGLRPVELDEVLARAALMTRVDRKYVLPVAAADAFVAELGSGAAVLEMEGRRSFRYESLYFDTDALDSYHLSARGRRRRFKVRRRTYLESDASYVEVKTRGARDRTTKERVLVVDGVTGTLGAAAGFVDDVLQRAGVGVRSPALAPGLVARYRRSTLLLDGLDHRVTVDTGLTWSLPGHPVLELTGLAVVETKSGSVASAADRLLWSRGHRPARISKYATGLAAVRPDLASNRWHPVMRRHILPVVPPS